MTRYRGWLAGREDHSNWFGDEDQAVLVDAKSGRVVGQYMHDGFGKWDIMVCLSYLKAWRVLRREASGFAGLAPFPRCWLWLFRMKSHEGAVGVIEQFARPVAELDEEPD